MCLCSDCNVCLTYPWRHHTQVLATRHAARAQPTTVATPPLVSTNVEYPTDSGLRARAVTNIGNLVRRIKAAGGATRTGFRDQSRAAARLRAIGAKLKPRSTAGRDEAQATVLRLRGELARLAEHVGRSVESVRAQTRRRGISARRLRSHPSRAMRCPTRPGPG